MVSVCGLIFYGETGEGFISRFKIVSWFVGILCEERVIDSLKRNKFLNESDDHIDLVKKGFSMCVLSG